MRKVSRYLPLWLLAFAYIPLRLFSLGGFVVTSNYLGLTRQEVILSAAALTGPDLGKLLWPVDLCAFYVFHKSSSVLDPRVLTGMLVGILLCAGFWWLWKRNRLASFGLLWLAVTLAPVLNPKWLGVNVFAERYLYLPSVGFCWVLGWELLAIWKRSRTTAWRRAFGAFVALVALAGTWRIVTRNRDWQDDTSLYTRTLMVSPDANLIRMNLARTYRSQGLLGQAETEYRTVLEQDPNCAECMGEFAGLLIEQANYSESKRLLTRAVQLNPKAVNARLNLGVLYQHGGFMKSAEEEASAWPQRLHHGMVVSLPYWDNSIGGRGNLPARRLHSNAHSR